MPTTESVLCVAFSARWMAEELVQAGANCRVCDWFADADTQQVAPVDKLKSWGDFLNLVKLHSPKAVVFGGGFEGVLDLVTQLPEQITLANSPANGAFRVTDPFELAEFAKKTKLDFPHVVSINQDTEFPKGHALQAQRLTTNCPISNTQASLTLHNDSRQASVLAARLEQGECWLTKKIRSGGGSHVTRLNSKCVPSANTYLQRFVSGTPISASFLATRDNCVLVGICRQLLGISQWGAKNEFQYSGAIGPFDFPFSVKSKIAQMGLAVSQTFKLRGLFGIDIILDPENRPWLIEVNPRPTGSMECLGRAAHENLMHWHLAEFNLHDRPRSLDKLQSIDERLSMVGKGILYLPDSKGLAIDDDLFAWLWARHLHGETADIPNAGDLLRSGNPLVTILAHGSTSTEVLTKLHQKAEEIFARLGFDPVP